MSHLSIWRLLVLHGGIGLAAVSVRADIIILKNDQELEGIIIKSSRGSIELQVSDKGFVSIDSATVVSVKRETVKQNSDRVLAWREQSLRALKEAQVMEAVERSQADKGLVKFKGEWMTPAERSALRQGELFKKEMEQSVRNQKEFQKKLWEMDQQMQQKRSP